ncbi:MAG: type II toxin-antitoxin system Phd/YefM family antitoxin [Chloroflexi bacterium]|nr:type II toxin-antitoxin system Phd/YefM family antitoxin [Chloroflexota bacterium]
MRTVTVSELKSKLGHYLDCTARGEAIAITRRGKVVGVLASPEPAPLAKKSLEESAEEGVLLWAGKKWEEIPKTMKLKGKPLSKYVL